ncbi:MAG: hypothetical protein AAGH46_10230, partial [Bacteroidota bacterium]
MKQSFYFLAVGVLLACGKQTNKSLEQVTMNSDISVDQLQDEGYTSGKIRFQENSSCRYVIELKQSDILYDPINLDDEKYLKYKV